MRNTLRFVVRRIAFYVFIAVVSMFFALPLLWLLTAPFDATPQYAVGFPDVTLESFSTIWHHEYALRSIGNSVLLSLAAMVLVVGAAALASYALSRVRIPGRDGLLYGLLLLSSVVTGTASLVPIFVLMDTIGLIDTRTGVVLVMSGGLLPAAVFMLKDFMDTIPKSYEESARVFGASPLRTLWDVVVPVARPGLATVAVWTIVQVWGNFLLPFVLLRDADLLPAAVVVRTFYGEVGDPDLRLISTFSLVYSVPVVLMYLFVSGRYGFRFHGGIKS